MKKSLKKQNIFNLTDDKNVINYLLICMILGSLLGGLGAYYYSNNFSINITEGSFLFNNLDYIELILKNLKFLIIIWFLGFINLGFPFIFLLDIIKGFSFGFTTSLIFKQFYFDGLKYAFYTYIPKAFLYIPFHLFISIMAIRNIKINKKCKNTYYNYRILFLIFLFSIFLSLLDLFLLKIF